MPEPITIQQAVNLAQRHQQAGRLAEAEGIYRQILRVQAEQPESLHGLGLIACQLNQSNAAIELINRAVVLRPDWVEAMSDLGYALIQTGRLEEAITACRQAILLRPRYAQAHVNLGIALKAIGRIEEAVAAYRQALQLRPDLSAVRNNLGNALMEKGEVDAAIAEFRAAIAAQPEMCQAYNNLGNAFKKKGRLEEAVNAYQRALALEPNLAAIHNNLGTTLHDMHRLDEAIASYGRAIALRPDDAEGYSNLGNSLRARKAYDEAIAACRRATGLQPGLAIAHTHLGMALHAAQRLAEAIAAYSQAVALEPDNPQAHANLGVAFADSGETAKAIAACRRAISLRPDFAAAHYVLSCALLLQGRFEEAWEEYDWRWAWEDFPSVRFNSDAPRWDGSDLSGRTILLYAEQGLGDVIQFARYVPLVVERGGTVIVRGYAPLRRILSSIAGRWKWVDWEEELPAFDVQCPLLSLPGIFHTTVESVPANVPYLLADPIVSDTFRNKLSGRIPALRAGLAWAGNPSHKKDRDRSVRLERLLPLLSLPGVQFFSLQHGQAAAEATTLPREVELVDWTSELGDFAETAALIDNLDLVITVDTAVAHLAGAMGKTVWVMLPFAPDWRWLLNRTDSPWYPTMRLFRQNRPGNWQDVIAELAEALSQWAGSRSPSNSSSGGG